MQIKLDENLGERGRQLFTAAGHDVATVAEEGLNGAADPDVLAACRSEGRCLVTLDLDFANPFAFPPESHAGVAVIRLPKHPTPETLDQAVQTLIAALPHERIVGR